MTKSYCQAKTQKQNSTKRNSKTTAERRMSGSQGESSIEDFQTEAILQQRLIPSTTQQQRAPPGPAAVATEFKDVSFSDEESRDEKLRGICKQTRAIKKNHRARRTPLRQISCDNSPNSKDKPKPRKVNHRKYTVKMCSNYLRKSIKHYAPQYLKELQQQRNRRGSIIYLPIGLLIMSWILKGSFKQFVKSYINQLNRLQTNEQKKFKATRNEKSYHYIIEFERAKKAICFFREGNELKCIEVFFGVELSTFKERGYLQQSINQFNSWRQKFGLPINFTKSSKAESTTESQQTLEPADTEHMQELNSESHDFGASYSNQMMMIESETTTEYTSSYQPQQNIFDVLDL